MKDTHAYAAMPIPDLYTWFATETAPTSPTWARLCAWIAATPEVCERLDALPGRKRQPNLFLGALRYLNGPAEPGEAFLAWLAERFADVEAVVLKRATQTNEPGRCAVLAPLLASLPQPVALLEVGASAGLCLLPDRYRYAIGGAVVDGAEAPRDAPVLPAEVTGRAPASPADLTVAFRAGLDANPLDAADPDDARWLRSLVWPGEDERERRLADALRVAAADPPTVLRGTAPADLPRLLDLVPAGATPVLMHSATLAYLARDERDEFERVVRASGARWVSLEGAAVVTSIAPRVVDPGRPHFVASLDGEPVAYCSPHGAWVDWL